MEGRSLHSLALLTTDPPTHTMTNYFPHPSNLRTQDAVLAMRMREGSHGYGVYMMLLELARDAENSKLANNPKHLAFAINEPDEELVQRVIRNYGLFDTDKNGGISSPWMASALASYKEAKAKASEAAKKAAAARWHKKEAQEMQNNAPAMRTHTDAMPNKTNQGDSIKQDQEDKPTKSKLREMSWKDWTGERLWNLAREYSMPITDEDIDMARAMSNDNHNRACVVECAKNLGVSSGVLDFLDDWTEMGLVGSKNLMYLLNFTKRFLKGEFRPKYINEYVLTSCLTYREI